MFSTSISAEQPGRWDRGSSGPKHPSFLAPQVELKRTWHVLNMPSPLARSIRSLEVLGVSAGIRADGPADLSVRVEEDWYQSAQARFSRHVNVATTKMMRCDLRRHEHFLAYSADRLTDYLLRAVGFGPVNQGCVQLDS